LSVDRHAMDTLAAEPKQPQRFQQRDMDLAADNDSERRRTKQPVAFDVPSGALEQRVPGRGETGDAGHRRSSHEHAGRNLWKAEQIAYPRERDLLARRSNRGHYAK